MKTKLSRISIPLILLTSCGIASAQTGAAFREKYVGNTSLTSHIYGMSFLTPSTGYVAFSDSIGFTQDSGHTFIKKAISATNTNFNNYAVNLTFGFSPRGVYTFSPDSLLVYGDFGAEPSILFSANQGNTWKLVFHQAFALDPDIGNSFFDMKFPSPGNGIVISQKFVVETTDKGQSWNVSYQIPGFFSNSRFAKLSTPTTSEIYIAAGDYVFKKMYGFWNAVAVPASPGLNYNTVSFISAYTGYITRDDNSAVYKTTDAGNSWIKMNDTATSPVFASDLYFINDSTGFAAARDNYNVLKTTDNGVTWEICKKNTNYQFGYYGMDRLFFLNNTIGWAGGRGEYLLLTTSGGNPTLPKATFKIDTTNLTATGNVNLISLSKPYYQHQWFKNGVLISTSVNASYIHDIFVLTDTIQLVVSNGVNSDTMIRYQDFLYTLLPVITSFTPAGAGARGTITITGTGFVHATSVTFGGVAPLLFTVNSNTSITAIIGGGLSGNIIVTTPNGSDTAGGFTFLLSPAPSVSSLNPPYGPIGTVVTITGNNFNPLLVQNIVHFGKVQAKILSASVSQIICEVPAGASFDPVTVVNVATKLRGASTKPFSVTFANSNKIYPTSFYKMITIPHDNIPGINIYPLHISTGDLDGDGKNDIAAAIRYFNVNDSIFIYKNRSVTNDIKFDPRIWVANGSYSTIGDIDNDGKMDMAIINSTGNIGVLINNSNAGSISFKPAIYFTGLNKIRTLSIGDVDGDGRADLVMAGYNDGNLGVLQNTSFDTTISFAPMLAIYAGVSSNSVAIGDLDGDGKNDIVISSSSNGNAFSAFIGVYRNTGVPGLISFAPRIDLPAVGHVPKTFIADVDNDNKPDIIATNNPQSGNNKDFSVYANSSKVGNLSFLPRQDFLNYNYEFPLTGEMDNITGDSLVDYITGNYYSGTFYTYQNISSPMGIDFNLAGQFGTNSGFESTVCSADLDGDGKPEITCTQFDGIEIFRNRIGEPVLQLLCPSTGVFNITSNISGSSYQWQVDSGNGFTNIANNIYYSGVNTSTLSLTNAPSSWYDHHFRCLVNGNYSDIYSLKFEVAWNSSNSNVAEYPLNWSCTILPDAYTDVIVPYGNIVINSNMVMRSLLIKPGATITVKAGYKLTIVH